MCPGELTLIFYQNREMTWDDVSFEQVVEFPMGSAGKTIVGSLAKKGSFISLSEKGTFKVTKLDATGFTGSFEFETEDESEQPLYVKGEFDLPCPQPKKCSDVPRR